MSKPHRQKPLIDISSLRRYENIAKAYSEHLDSELNIRIGAVIRDSLDKACSKVPLVKTRHPWEDPELQSMMLELRKTPQNGTLCKQV